MGTVEQFSEAPGKPVAGPPEYPVRQAHRITGILDTDALRAAWREVVRRHGIQRGAFLEFADMSAPPVGEVNSRFEWLYAGRQAEGDGGRHGGPGAEPPTARKPEPPAARKPEPDGGPGADPDAGREKTPSGASAGEAAARLILVRLARTEHLLLLALRREVAGGRSAAILTAELSACYEAVLAGRPARDALPPLAVPLAVPFTVPLTVPHPGRARRHDEPDAAGSERDLDWWVSALTPPPPPTTPPVDRARPAGDTTHAGLQPFEWDDDLGRRLAEVAEARDTTPGVVLLAALHTLLHRYGDADRVAVGVPGTPDPRPGVPGTLHPMAPPRVICADFSGTPTFGELLARVTRFAREASGHRAVSPDRLARALGGTSPFTVMAVLPDGPEPELRLPGTVTGRERLAERGPVTARADLTLVVDRVRPGIAGALEYRAALFDRSSARLVLEQLRTLLTAALAEPDTPVGELPLDEPESVRRAVREADRIADAVPAELPVHGLVRRWAERHPEAEAVVWDGSATSYRELRRRAETVTAALRALGGVGGSPVVVRVAPGPLRFAALLGVLGAGGHLAWFGTGDAGERGKAIIEDLRPACLVVDGTAAGDGLARWYREELNGRVLDLAAPRPEDPRHEDPRHEDPRLEEKADEDPGEGAAPYDGPDGRAYVAHTSGSTGRPKGVPQTHAALAQFTTWMAAEFGIGPGSRVANWVAPEHDPALCEVFATLVSGATLYPVPERVRLNPDALADWLVEQRITLIQTVPSFAGELLGVIEGREPAERPSSLRHILLMGEALSGELVNGLRAALPGTRLVNLYGPTETIAATWYEAEGAVHGPVPIGRPIPGRQVLVLDDADRPCPTGVTGDIVVRTPYVTSGYLGAGAGDDSAFRPVPGLASPEPGHGSGSGLDRGPDGPGAGAVTAGWYRTGDLGRRRRDGLLEFRGRGDFQVKLLGNRVELTEIEAALTEHDSVAECAVVPLTGQDGLVTRLVVCVVPRDTPHGPAGSPKVWRDHLRRRFGAFTLPASFETLGSRLPRNLAGKVDRRGLRQSMNSPKKPL
ncbi:AMP-binding protein [Streptosporangium sp. NPDC051022]|uniref:AMP-binding protein n=1 Tax=Streptosporangium sp. NPDC051022 TaxID=3155752 RepID=UPI00343D26CC